MLEAVELVKDYHSGTWLSGGKKTVRAVDRVSFHLAPGETLGLVGESGCGKSTLGRLLLLLERPAAGKVFFENIELTALKGEALRKMRRKMQLVFQDSFSSFDPRYSVEKVVGEPLQNFLSLSAQEKRQRILNVLESVELSEEYLGRFPHELSGGQRQRVGLARALAPEPALIVLDEPLSSLDLSVQSQILNLLMKIKREHRPAFLFISHDLRAVRFLSDRIAVMYMGRLVEIFPVSSLNRVMHPYTRLLLSSIPVTGPAQRDERVEDDQSAAGDIRDEDK
ncbi:MAG: ATP-binding cassette domain-containing protein, partial [Peptococcaceae bacterium]|nr:ATP-binding cassette domain-containing protein [Peptococcaceae bacterium]